MITDFLSGNVDLAFDMTQADFDAVNAVAPEVGKAELDSAWQYEHFDLMSAGGSRLGGTVAKHGLDDLDVRTAIAMAVNKQDLTDVLFPGAGVSPACSIAPPGTPWRDDSVTCAPFDVDGANAKLDTNWPVNADTGLRTNKDGDTIRLQLCTTAGNPTRLTELSKLNQYLTAVSIPSDVSTADASQRRLRRLGRHDRRHQLLDLSRHVRHRRLRLRARRRHLQQLLLHVPLVADPLGRQPERIERHASQQQRTWTLR